MKILKYLLFLILIFIIGASIYIATKDGNFQVEESRTINAPQEVVFSEVNDISNWKDWEPWSKETDDMIIKYGDTLSGEGASYSWTSENMGNGKIVTVKSNPFSSIDQQIIFETPFGDSKSEVYWVFEEQGDSTKVTWGMKGDQSFMEKVAFTFQDQSINEMMRPMFKKGLNNLEDQVREKMNSYSINVDGITQHGGGYYMYTSTASKISQVQEKMEQMVSEVSNYMTQNNIEKVGKPFVLYNEWNEEQGTAIYSAGYFTPSQVVTPAESNILNGYLARQRTLKTTLIGDYKNFEEAWDAAYSYMEKNGLEAKEDASPFEVYITGPNDNANPAKWVTHIYIPLAEESSESDD